MSKYRAPRPEELRHDFPCEVRPHCKSEWYPVTLKLVPVLTCGMVLAAMTDKKQIIIIHSLENVRIPL